MITEDIGIEIPDWFYKKYREGFHFQTVNKKHKFPISSKFEMKTYFETYQNLIKDLQKLVDSDYGVSLVFLHECGGITKVDIYKDHIYWGEPDGWINLKKDVDDGVTHNYCYGCSDLKKFINSPKTKE